MSHPEVTAQFTLRFSELVQGVAVAYRRPLLILTPTLAITTGLATGSPMAGVMSLITFPIVAIAITAGGTWWTHVRLRRPAMLTFDDDGVTSGDPADERSVGWEAFRDARPSGDIYVLVLHRRGQVIVPRRGFASDAEEASFRSLVEARVAPPSWR